MTRRHTGPIVVLVLALAVLTWSVVWAATSDRDERFGMMRSGSGMAGYAMSGSGAPVRDLAGAKCRAARFANGLDLRVGEVMRFDNQYYAELTERDGRGATEVVVDPSTGAVMLEPGPAMMWNTRFGMMGGTAMMNDDGSGPGGYGPGGMAGGGGMMGVSGWAPVRPRSGGGNSVGAAQARAIAARWLGDAEPGATVGEPEAFPGYFTLHTLRGGKPEGMLSVNASTGAVWYHSWHGRFIEMVQ